MAIHDLSGWQHNHAYDTGNLAGDVFTIASGSFTAAHVAADQVIVLIGGTSGCYPIVTVDSATQLTVSVLYDGLFPTSGDPVAGRSAVRGTARLHRRRPRPSQRGCGRGRRSLAALARTGAGPRYRGADVRAARTLQTAQQIKSHKECLFFVFVNG